MAGVRPLPALSDLRVRPATAVGSAAASAPGKAPRGPRAARRDPYRIFLAMETVVGAALAPPLPETVIVELCSWKPAGVVSYQQSGHPHTTQFLKMQKNEMLIVSYILKFQNSVQKISGRRFFGSPRGEQTNRRPENC